MTPELACKITSPYRMNDGGNFASGGAIFKLSLVGQFYIAGDSRKFAIQIKTLYPYISSLDENVQQEVKKELTGKFFVGFEPKCAK